MRRVLLVFAIAFRVGAQEAPAHFKAGRAAYAAKNAEEAVKEFEKAVALDDRNATLHLWLARAIALQSERASFARVPFLAKRIRTEYERTIELDSSSIGGHQGLLEVYLGPGLFGGSMGKAHAEAETIARLNGLRGHIARATIANREKDTATVEREWRLAATEFPDSLVAVNGYADRMASTQRNDGALAALERFVARRPDDARGLLALGRMVAITGVQLDRGEQALRMVLAAPGIGSDSTLPPPASAHYWLGGILARKGLADQAKAEYRRALELNPNLDAARQALKALKAP